jgi:hypothetical protein
MLADRLAGSGCIAWDLAGIKAGAYFVRLTGGAATRLL